MSSLHIALVSLLVPLVSVGLTYSRPPTSVRKLEAYQYRDYLMYDVIMRSNIVNLWSRIWQDLISHSLFGFFAEMGRKADDCADALRGGWKAA